MKKALSLFLILILMFVGMNGTMIVSADDSGPEYTLSYAGAKVGGSFTMAVGINNHTGIIALNFLINYDPNKAVF